MSVFGDALAMVLVVVGAALTGLLIWLLIRKYDREHEIKSKSPGAKADVSVSPQSPASTVLSKDTRPAGRSLASPQAKDSLSVSPTASPPAKEPVLPTNQDSAAATPAAGPLASSPQSKKQPQGTFPITSSSGGQLSPLLAGSALSRLSPPGAEDRNVPSSDEAQRVAKSPPEDEQAQENTKRSEATGKLQEKNSTYSQNFSRERSSRDQHSKRKAKKHGAASLNTTNMSAAKRKSKRSAPAKSATALLSPSHVTPMDVAAAPPTQPAPPDNEKTEPLDAKELHEVKHGGNANDPSIPKLRDTVVLPASSGYTGHFAAAATPGGQDRGTSRV